MEETASDLISELPESIIGHILSFLYSTREAIRTSVLSKRWQYIWTSVPVLILQFEDDIYNYNGGLFSSLDRTLALRGDNKLQKFALLTDRWHDTPHRSHINHWISYAIRCNVEELEIRGHYLLLECPQQLFGNSCMKKLSLDYCGIWDPIGEIKLKNLTSLRLAHGYVNRESISKLLSGSPSLETLELVSCEGLDGLNITCTGLRKLIINSHCSGRGVFEIDKFKINAPNILSLEITGLINSDIILMDVGSVVEATLDFDTSFRRSIGQKVLMCSAMKNWSSLISRCKYLQINVVKYAKRIECLASTPRLVFKNECASFFTRPYNEIIWFVLVNASVFEKIVIRVSPGCGPEAKMLQSLLKLRGFILASEEELLIILEKLI